MWKQRYWSITVTKSKECTVNHLNYTESTKTARGKCWHHTCKHQSPGFAKGLCIHIFKKKTKKPVQFPQSLCKMHRLSAAFHSWKQALQHLNRKKSSTEAMLQPQDLTNIVYNPLEVAGSLPVWNLCPSSLTLLSFGEKMKQACLLVTWHSLKPYNATINMSPSQWLFTVLQRYLICFANHAHSMKEWHQLWRSDLANITEM